MSFDTFVHSLQSVLGILIQLVTLIGSILAFRKVHKMKRLPPPAPDAKRPYYRLWIVIFVILILIFLLLFVIWISSPRVAIAKSADGYTVDVILHGDTGSSEFRVRGTASHLKSNSSRRIYLLVHPDDPPAPGWWIQPAVSLDSEGNWNGVAWIGTRGWEAKPGQTLWIQAVVAERRSSLPVGKDGVPWVDDPEELDPATMSKVVHATVGRVTAGPGR
jgi:hypothetical protein